MAPIHSKSILLPLLFITVLLIVSLTFSLSTAIIRDPIAISTQVLAMADNETFVSAGGIWNNYNRRRYIGIWNYNNNTGKRIVWVANRAMPVIGSTGQLSLTANCTIRITNRESTVVWSVVTNITGLSNPVVQFLDSELVVTGEYSDNTQEYYSWQRLDYPTDTCLPGMKLGVDKVAGLSRNLTAWNSADDPIPGDYYAAMGIVRNFTSCKSGDDPSPGDYCPAMVIGDNSPPDIYLFHSSSKIGRRGPRDGIQLGRLISQWGPNDGFSIRQWTDSSEEVWTYSSAIEVSVQPMPTVDVSLGRLEIQAWGNAASHSQPQKANSQPQKANWRTIVVIVSLLSGTLLLSYFILFLWRKKKRRRVILGRTIFFSDKLDEDDRTRDLDLPLFNFGTIATATESFSAENKLGQGGFGPVYKGTLGGDKEIAVKRLAKSSQQGAKEFKNEVILIAKLQNRYIVRLLGCCIHGEERMLIYEYMPNKSLDAFIFAKEKAALLGWQTRYQIIIGITRGLLYLHHDSRYRIIHRDLKASNILLDKEMNPKISDFGMARLFGGDETDYNTRKIVGTYGYMSPEYAMEGIFSLKSDVYSFGVLLLEIISGRKNRGSYAFSQHLNLVAHAWSLWNEDKSLELVDEAMNNNFPSNDVLKCIKIGLLCVQNHSEDRPLMPFVLEMLGASVDITSLPHPKQPGFIARMDPLELDHISNNRDSCTLNELTVTLDGR